MSSLKYSNVEVHERVNEDMDRDGMGFQDFAMVIFLC